MTELVTEIGENKYRLSLGDNDEESKLSIEDVSGKFIEFDIFLKIKNKNDVKRLKNIFHAEGGSVKKLSWTDWSEYEMSAADVIEMLNYFSKLEILELSSWHKKFTGGCCEKIQLPNIKSLNITYCDNFIIDFLTNFLPDNSISELTINNVNDVEDKLYEFIKKQRTIKKLTLCEDLKTIELFILLNLESLCCPIRHDDEKIKKQRKFLKNKFSINLKRLDLLTDSDSMFSFVTNAMFADICALSKLESLSMNIESMTPKGIKAISNLTALKTFNIKAAFENSTKLKTLKKFSGIKNSLLKNLTLSMWFDIPDKIYKEIGQNYQNLSSLTIALGTNQRFSFFAQAFPNLERFNVKFGDANNPIAFEEVYHVNDIILLPKLKTLILEVSSNTLINTKLFFNFLSIFKNLEKLEIDSKFPFTADFVNHFANNLNNIKSVRLISFEINNDEKFASDIVDALKLLRSRLNYVFLLLKNTQNKWEHDSEAPNDEQSRFDDFTYKPLKDELKDIFRLRKSVFVHLFIYNELIMESGKRESWGNEDEVEINK